jgi:hypothetical protein
VSITFQGGFKLGWRLIDLRYHRARRNQIMSDKPSDNIEKLHAHEEQLRVESLALIAKRDDLTDHWKLVSGGDERHLRLCS